MKEYRVAIDLKKVYHLKVSARNEAEARKLAEALNTIDIPIRAEFQDAEFDIIEITEN